MKNAHPGQTQTTLKRTREKNVGGQMNVISDATVKIKSLKTVHQQQRHAVFRFLQSQALYFQWLIVAVTSQSHVTSSGTSWARHTDWWTKRSWGGRACARLSRTRMKSKDCRRHRASCTVIINVIMTWLLTNTTAIHVNLAGAETKVEGSASAAGEKAVYDHEAQYKKSYWKRFLWNEKT